MIHVHGVQIYDAIFATCVEVGCTGERVREGQTGVITRLDRATVDALFAA